MKFCTNCGSQLSDDALFCSGCGQKQEVVAPTVETPVATPVVETPVVETPVVETPVVETPVATPVVETPVAETAPFQPTQDTQFQPFQQQAPVQDAPFQPFHPQAPAQDAPFQPQAPAQDTQFQPFQQQATPFQQQAAPQFNQNAFQQQAPVYNNAYDPQPKKKSKAPLIIGLLVAIVAAVAVLFFVFKSIGIGGKPYESAFKNLCGAINNQDVDKLFKLFPPEMEELMETYMKMGDMDEDEIMDEIFGSMGAEDIKVSYKIEGDKRLDKEDLEEYIDYYGDEVTDGYEVEVTLIAEMDGEKEETEEEMVLIKIDGRWCFEELLWSLY